jgi:hypothetical protein
VRLWFAPAILLIGISGCRSSAEAPTPNASAASHQKVSAASPAPRSCGRGASEACPATEYCDDPYGLCARRDDLPGACRPRPTTCAKIDDPVCGCDTKIYKNACEAHVAGVDESLNGGCAERLPGRIPCGPRYCDARTTYCEIVLSDVAELPSDFTCKPLPAGCVALVRAGNSSCSCLPTGTRCSSFCVVVDAGDTRGLRLTCVGGY